MGPHNPTFPPILALALLISSCGCHAPSTNPSPDPPKLAAMTSLLGSLRSHHAGRAELIRYVATIAPTFSAGSAIRFASEPAFDHEIRWSRDTIRSADAATVVEIISRGGQIAQVDVTTYYWRFDRWRSDEELARELHPAEFAALEKVFNHRLTTRPSTQPYPRWHTTPPQSG